MSKQREDSNKLVTLYGDHESCCNSDTLLGYFQNCFFQCVRERGKGTVCWTYVKQNQQASCNFQASSSCQGHSCPVKLVCTVQAHWRAKRRACLFETTLSSPQALENEKGASGLAKYCAIHLLCLLTSSVMEAPLASGISFLAHSGVIECTSTTGIGLLELLLLLLDAEALPTEADVGLAEEVSDECVQTASYKGKSCASTQPSSTPCTASDWSTLAGAFSVCFCEALFVQICSTSSSDKPGKKCFTRKVTHCFSLTGLGLGRAKSNPDAKF